MLTSPCHFNFLFYYISCIWYFHFEEHLLHPLTLSRFSRRLASGYNLEEEIINSCRQKFNQLELYARWIKHDGEGYANCPIFESTQEQPRSRPRVLSVPYFEMAGITLGTSFVMYTWFWRSLYQLVIFWPELGRVLWQNKRDKLWKVRTLSFSPGGGGWYSLSWPIWGGSESVIWLREWAQKG